jgi:hypothetical protein
VRRRILLASLAAVLVAMGAALGLRPGVAHATTVAPPLSGTSYTVNNGPGDQTDPHVSGDWVVYSNFDGTNSTIHYYSLTQGIDYEVPNSGTFDFLSDISGTTIVFTRVTATKSAIYSFDIATDGPAIELAPVVGSIRREDQIGGSTVAWQEFPSVSSPGISNITLYDLKTQTLIPLTSDLALNQQPAVSPDGTVVTWVKCATVSSPCDVWDAVLSNGTWTSHQLTNQQGACAHPDSNSQIVAYSCDRGSGDQLFWQPATGGVEHQFAISLNQSTPSMDGNLIAFAYRPPGIVLHGLWVYDLVHDTAYPVTSPPGDVELNDISVSPSGTATVVWQDLQSDENVYAFRFADPAADTTPPVLTLPGPITVDATSPAGAVVSYTVGATDPDGSSSPPTINCAPPSGSTFAITTTTVQCKATDSAGNSAGGAFEVTVKGAVDQLGDLIGAVQNDNLKQGIANSLDAKVQSVQAAVTAANAGNRSDACNALGAFIDEAQAQSGNALTADQAAKLIAAAQQIQAVLGC